MGDFYIRVESEEFVKEILKFIFSKGWCWAGSKSRNPNITHWDFGYSSLTFDLKRKHVRYSISEHPTKIITFDQLRKMIQPLPLFVEVSDVDENILLIGVPPFMNFGIEVRVMRICDDGTFLASNGWYYLLEAIKRPIQPLFVEVSDD